ncbi:MAG TPA: MATE family efflux transporter [Cellvibrionaceae bacterium]
MPPIPATLTQGSVPRHLYTLALPMVWGLLATMSFNVVDTFFVAQLGKAPLAAMSFTFPVVMVLTSIGIGLGAGTSSVVARGIGEGNTERARRFATDAVTLTLLIAICVCGLGWFFMDPLFRLLGDTDELLPLIRAYMTLWYISAPCLLVPMVALASLRAMGLSRIQGWLMGCAALFNALLDPLLIFGLWGFPALGIEGAALATLITRLLMMTAALYILIVRVKLLVNPLAGWAVLMRSWGRIVHVAAPAMGANLVVPLASAVVVMMVASYGPEAVAGLGIAIRIEPVALIVFYALSGVIGPFFGQNLGAGKWQRLHQAQRVLILFCVGFGLLLTVCLWLFGRSLAGLFSDDPAVIDIASRYLLLVPISYGAYGIVMSVNAAFNGLGKPWPAMVISVCRVLAVYLPLALMLQTLWQIQGLFLATALSNVFVGTVAAVWLHRTLPTRKFH